MPQYYPIFADLTYSSCLIVGFGEVGRRKAAMLLPAHPARILVLDPLPPDSTGEQLLQQGKEQGIDMELSHEPFSPGMLDAMTLVFTCSGDHAFNARIAALCRERHILCNCTDAPEEGSFHVPVVVRKDPLVAALSTGRASPALAKRWKEELAEFLAGKVPVTKLMGHLRPLILAMGAPSSANRTIFRDLARPNLEEAIAKGDKKSVQNLLEQILPEQLHASIPELLANLPSGDTNP